MKTKDLKELQEMTGLVTEAEFNKMKADELAAEKEIANKYSDDSAKLRKECVGRYIRVEKNLGLCDDVHILSDGVYLGFVFATSSEWVGKLVKPEDAVLLTDEPSIRAAKKSAGLYFALERGSVTRCIQRYKAEGRDTSELESRLANIDEWLVKIK